jgi:hypothetical protein
MRSLAAVFVVMLLATTAFAADGWSVTPPSGWTEDMASGSELRSKTKDAFFVGLGVETDGKIYRSSSDPLHSVMIVQILHLGADTTPAQAIDQLSSRMGNPTMSTARRVENGETIADWQLQLGASHVQATSHALRDASGELHVITVVCREPTDGAECAPVIASTHFGSSEASAQRGLGWWLKIAGIALFAIGILGWLVVRRRP